MPQASKSSHGPSLTTLLEELSKRPTRPTTKPQKSRDWSPLREEEERETTVRARWTRLRLPRPPTLNTSPPCKPLRRSRETDPLLDLDRFGSQKDRLNEQNN